MKKIRKAVKKGTTTTFVIEERSSGLPYMVTWQSLDGRIAVDYYQTLDQARDKAKHLTGLDRTPKLFVEITP